MSAPIEPAPKPQEPVASPDYSVEDDYASPVDWGDENPGYADPNNPTGYEAP